MAIHYSPMTCNVYRTIIQTCKLTVSVSSFSPGTVLHGNVLIAIGLFDPFASRMPVSLFYCYYDVDDVDGLATWVRTECARLGLRGRVRVATEGINATLGGSETALSSFETSLESRADCTIDFKRSPGDADVFPALTVRVCSQLVTLGVSAPWRYAAPSLSPRDFLTHLRSGEPLLIDARNVYESAIGHFRNAILPRTRAFSEFPAFLRSTLPLFSGRQVLMYCTGGIRCETASSLLKSYNVASDVYQLQGGIHRFLEQYPDGAGEFVGKNLVFDGRGAITPTGTTVGRCFMCDKLWDDYNREARCGKCRARVLICDDVCEKRFRETINLCVTCATEKPQAKKKKKTRRKRIIKWLAKEECHASLSAATGKVALQ